MSLPKEDSVVKPAQKKARDKWDKENMTTLSCKVKKEQAEKVKAHALSRGETVNGFVNRAITETMQRDSSEKVTAQNCADLIKAKNSAVTQGKKADS